jgi:uncharacterized membrane protein YbhN (UPF0104 family)
MLCTGLSLLVSTLLGLVNLSGEFVPARFLWAFRAAVVALFAGALVAAPMLVGFGAQQVQRLFRLELKLDPIRPRLMIDLGVLYLFSWGLFGLSLYCAGRGVALDISSADIVAITASISLGWAIGYLTALTPGGLGVREGVMFLVLDQTTSPHAALLLPVISRLLSLLLEVTLAGVGFVVGVKLHVFGDASSVPAGGPLGNA